MNTKKDPNKGGYILYWENSAMKRSIVEVIYKFSIIAITIPLGFLIKMDKAMVNIHVGKMYKRRQL